MQMFLYLFVLLFLASPCSAGLIHRSGAGTVGKAQINLGAGELTAQLTTNLFEVAPITFQAGTNSPAALDSNNFPVANFSGVITGTLGATSPALATTGPFLFAWDAGRSCFKINFISSATITGITNATIVNGGGSGNPSITGNCSQAGSVTINWNSTSSINYQWDGTYTQWASNTTGKFYLARSSNIGWSGQSDAVAFQNGIYWTLEAISFIKALLPESIRPMGWNIQNGNGSTTNVVNWGYRKTTNAFSFSALDFPPGTRCGSAASGPQTFCTISVSNGALSAAAATDTSFAGWVDGEQLTGNVASTVSGLAITNAVSNGGNCQFTVSSTTGLSNGNPTLIEGVLGATECNAQTTILSVDSATQFTIPVAKINAYTSGGFAGYQTLAIPGKSGGSKIIINNLAGPIGSSGDTLASGLATFTYNATLDLVIYSPNGIANAVPLEAQIQLANLINANFWYNFPAWSNDAFVTNSLNTIYSNLNFNLKAIFELDNELWNFAFKNTRWAVEMGGVLGITPRFANNSLPLPWQALRNRQIFGNLIPASNFSATMSRIDRTYGFQLVSSPASAMQGSGLISPGNAAYQAYVGGSAVNYNTSPNRPIDFTDSIAYAPYLGGGTAFSGQSPDTTGAPTTFDAALLNSIVTAWNIPDQNTAESLIDQSVRGDIQNRVQTVSNSGTTFSTPLTSNFSQFDILRFTGTPGAGCTINLLTAYQVLTVAGANFTIGQVVNGVASAAVNPGTCPGSGGSLSIGDLGAGSNGNFNRFTVFSMMSGYYTKHQTLAVSGFSPAPANGAPKVRWYEGAPEPSAPTTAQCATISINSTDCATLAAALIGWKNSSFAAATIAYYYQTFVGTAPGTITTGAMPNSSAPAQLVLQGGGLYGLNSNQSYVAPAVYQLYNGFAAFSAN